MVRTSSVGPKQCFPIPIIKVSSAKWGIQIVGMIFQTEKERKEAFLPSSEIYFSVNSLNASKSASAVYAFITFIISFAL
ncbi:MAG: DUF6783 domain-containing protein [Lachnospiraceae bacterium]